ncbi:PE-PPE domain-containing protein [Amycolatopsis antarctica]|nr:PE-PPE domain-containing protein [Amycolatopsis antarctica]
MRKGRRAGLIGMMVTALAAGAIGATASFAQAETTQQAGHHYILIGGTCDGPANVYNNAWLGGGNPVRVNYPAGGPGLPGCDQTPMDVSINIGHENANRAVVDTFNAHPGDQFTIVGYSQGAIVANRVLNDLANGALPVDKGRFSAKLYADPMQPVGPPGTGIGANIPPGMGVPFGGYISPGPGRTEFNGIPFIRYCIDSDGVCHFNTPEAAGGYFAQHQCYQWARPDGRSIMSDSLADGVYTNGSVGLGRQNCRPPFPS